MDCPKCGKRFTGVENCTEESCYFQISTQHPDTISVGLGVPHQNISEVGSNERDLYEEYKAKYEQKQHRAMKNVFNWLKGFLGGDNKAGQALHGLLNVLPIPEDFVSKTLKAVFAGEWGRAKEEIAGLWNVKTMVALVASIAYFAGWISFEEFKGFFEWVMQFIPA